MGKARPENAISHEWSSPRCKANLKSVDGIDSVDAFLLPFYEADCAILMGDFVDYSVFEEKSICKVTNFELRKENTCKQ